MASSPRSRHHRNPPIQEVQHERSRTPFFSKAGAPPPSLQTKREAFFQPKLTIGQPDDQYEREADRVADAVTSKPEGKNAPAVQKQEISSIQRLATPDERIPSTNDARMAEEKQDKERAPVQRAAKGGVGKEEKPLQMKAEEEERLQMKAKEEEPLQMKAKEEEPLQMKAKEEEPLQMKAENGGNAASNETSAKINSSKGQGERLPGETKRQMESAFGRDFSGVTIHKDARSENLNQELRAQAFTHGQDIYFNAGKFNPESGEGKKLLAHELTHVVQQGKSAEKIQRYDTPEHAQFGKTKSGEEIITIDGVEITYGEAIAMGGDFFENPNELWASKKGDLAPLVKLVRESKKRKVGDDEWDKVTKGRYSKLALKNNAHFAPSNKKLISPSGTTSGEDHKSTWERYHQEAINEFLTGNRDKALTINAFADHFLTDAFAAGHLFNKQDVVNRFKNKLPDRKKWLFEEMSKRSFPSINDKLKNYELHYFGVWTTFNKEYELNNFLLEINDLNPEAIENGIIKGIHDSLNSWDNKAGVEVTNKKGNIWQLSGDETLNSQTLEIILKAVASSKTSIMSSTSSGNPYEAWDYTPNFTEASLKAARNDIETKSDPGNEASVNALSNLLISKINFILAKAATEAPNKIRKKN